MLTRSASVSPVHIAPQRIRPPRTTTGSRQWARYQPAVLEHVAVLEQATLAVLEGYLGGPLYHRAAHAARQLLVLTETMAWHEGIRVARTTAHLFHSHAAFDLVHALHLSEMLAAFYREMARASARQTHTQGRDTTGGGCITLCTRGASLPARRDRESRSCGRL